MFRHEAPASHLLQTLPAPGVVPSVLYRLARREALLIAVEGQTIVCRHAGPLKVAAEVPFTLSRNGHSMSANGTVTSCRVAALGAGEGGATLYETRVLLTHGAEASELLHFLEVDFR